MPVVEMVFAIVLSLLVVLGGVFALLAAIGVLRFPDLYTRMHAASKAGTVGSSLLLIAAGLHAGDSATLFRALAGVVFLLMTAPVAAHLLAKAAHRSGHRLDRSSVMDALEHPADRERRR
ncbi:monovalent cation/H(+) antiporter subunit G [Pararhizobium arenae]|uniref:monovalent cation/H(+) antiporter subunit G n=1 Tax=Pararhizobium arenae TaxID=1856850 RepID=UPI00094AD339|nr:monovalent cation/H(+) antiporter subunit G [Pararhizobium arenae]